MSQKKAKQLRKEEKEEAKATIQIEREVKSIARIFRFGQRVLALQDFFEVGKSAYAKVGDVGFVVGEVDPAGEVRVYFPNRYLPVKMPVNFLK